MKIGVKEILILVLAGALVLSFVFRPSNNMDYYVGEINNLKQQNGLLLGGNDSLKTQNESLTQEIKDILITVDSTSTALVVTKGKLKDLEDEKDKVSDRVRVLDADGIASELTDYLNRE
jgi:chromosome segregation ATPase